MMRKEWLLSLALVLLGAGPPGTAPARDTGACNGADCGLEAATRKLGSSERSERMDGLSALAQLGPGASAAVPKLAEVLRNSSDGRERSRAAEALGWIRSTQAVPALLEALQSPSWRLQWEAATALGRIGSPDAVSALEPLSKEHWFSPVRRAAAKALESIQKAKKAPRPAHKAQDVIAARQAALQEQAVPAAEQCWNAEKKQWRVRRGERSFTLEPPDPTWAAKRPQNFPDLELPSMGVSFLRVDEGWLVGLNGGEFRGELWLVTEEGKKTVLAKGDNFLGFARTSSGPVVFTGLSHLIINEGAIHDLVRGDDRAWTPSFRMELPGRPQDWQDVDGSLIVAMSDAGVVELPEEGSPRMLPCQ